MQLALDQATNDLFKPIGGGVSRVSEGRYTIQAVRSRLKTYLGEWILDETAGWLNFEDYDRGFDLFDIETRAREVILGTKGIETIIDMKSSITNRILRLEFSATTEYGIISLDIPFSISGV